MRLNPYGKKYKTAKSINYLMRIKIAIEIGICVQLGACVR